MRKPVFGYTRTAKTKISLRIRASSHSDQVLRCSQTVALDNIECFNGEKMPGCDNAHVQDGVNSHIFAHARGHVFAWRSKRKFHRSYKR